MSTQPEPTTLSERELVLTRVLEAPPEKVFRPCVPSEQPLMTVVITFENVDGKTLYTSGGLHWTVAERQHHEKMGFYEG